jgi:hypothetical protein
LLFIFICSSLLKNMLARFAFRSVAQQTSLLSCSRGFHVSGAAYRLVTEVVPPLGESITEGTIAKWMKMEGDSVNADDVVLVVETDKVTVDIKATLSGKIIRRLVESDNVSPSNFGNNLSAFLIVSIVVGCCR